MKIVPGVFDFRIQKPKSHTKMIRKKVQEGKELKLD